MVDINELREKPEAYLEACKKKGVKIDINEVLKLDAAWRELRATVEGERSKQNQFSKEIGKYKGDERQAKLAEMKTISEQLKGREQELRDLEAKRDALLLRVPSIPSAKTPVGKDDTENVEVKRWGEIPKFDFKPKSHAELGESLDIIDIERGVKIAGSRSYFLKGDGMRLQHAVMTFTMDTLHKRGFTLMDPPHIVGYDAMCGTSYFPGGEDQAYRLDERDPNFYLIGTAEVPVTSYHSGEILELSALPKKYAGYSPCYRREAGTYGKDTSGLYRVHQFHKVEQVIVCEADAEVSAKFHSELLKNAEDVLQALKVPYRVVDVCTGDMGLGQVYKNDIEAWMPFRNGWGETHSCSTFHDFQARRLQLRYKDQSGKTRYCHTLNNTCIASPRILIPLLELFQTADGRVVIPEVLVPYMGGQKEITPKK
jgi:seryl-tRNA synthetase